MSHSTKITWAVGTALAAALALSLGAHVAQGAEEKASRKYIGAKKCSICHKKEEAGSQYGKWLESPHAKAYETLAGEKAVAKAKELGIANAQEAPECLKCHATAFAVVDEMDKHTVTLEEGVSCESCHGPGGDYWKKKTMEAIFAGEIDAESVGLLVPVPESTCVGCHNPDNPFHKEFDFDEFSAKIAHHYPDGFRSGK